MIKDSKIALFTFIEGLLFPALLKIRIRSGSMNNCSEFVPLRMNLKHMGTGVLATHPPFVSLSFQSRKLHLNCEKKTRRVSFEPGVDTAGVLFMSESLVSTFLAQSLEKSKDLHH